MTTKNWDNIDDEGDGLGEFKYFQLSWISFSQTVGLFGRRASGKTTFTLNLLQNQSIPRGIVMCPTPEAITTYGDAIPASYIYDYFDEGIIKKICNFQNALKLRLHHELRREMAQLEAQAAIDRKNQWFMKEQSLKQRCQDENLSAKQVDILYERMIHEEEEENQINIAKRKKWEEIRKLELQQPNSMFCVFDDLSSDPDAMRSRTLKKLMDNGRHYLMLLIIACQVRIG